MGKNSSGLFQFGADEDKKEPLIQEREEKKPSKDDKSSENEDENDWGAVPAFLRRDKK